MATTTTNTCKKCGCEDSFMPSPAPCPTPIGCPTPEPCSEVIDAQCVIYTGNNIVCGQDTVVTTNDNVAEAIENIVDYFCGGESSSVTLTDAGTGTHESLVNDGTGPTLATKGLKAGNAVSLSSTGTDITITNNAPDQVVSLTAGADVSITGTYPNFTITNTAPNVNQNLWATIAATTGSTTANTTTDTLTVVGAGGVSTSITGDTLTITGSGGGGSQFTYEIGQYVPSEGGVIAHRWLSSTPLGSPTSGSVQNYIVVDTSNLSSGAVWASLNTLITSVESTFNGASNTANLITAGAPSGITAGTAAVLCNSSTNNGQTDWYLPAIDELSKIWQNRWDIEQGIINASGTPIDVSFYWSSTQGNAAVVLYYDFTTGQANLVIKSSTLYVRAVRRFSI